MASKKLSPLFTWRSAIASGESELEPSSRLVALVLSLHMNERGGSCFPSINTISKESGLDRKTVIRHLAALEERGWLEVRHGGSPRGARKESNRYSAVVPAWVGGDDEDVPWDDFDDDEVPF